MRRNGLRTLTTASILLAFSGFGALALSGTDLYQSCVDKKKGLGDFMCVAYIHGFLDGITFGHTIGKRMSNLYCPPAKGISVDQGRLIVEKYLREHPEKLHEQAGTQVASAILEAFMCTKSN